MGGGGGFFKKNNNMHTHAVRNHFATFGAEPIKALLCCTLLSGLKLPRRGAALKKKTKKNLKTQIGRLCLPSLAKCLVAAD